MVVSKDAKRKRKEPQISERIPETPKRTKVQAQRKFAQGQGTSSTSYPVTGTTSSTAASGSQPSTPIKEGPSDVIANRRPRTEDFLTFLCYRGTSVLPSHLDFLNTNKNSNKQETSSANKNNTDNDCAKPLPTTSKKVEKDRADSSNKKEDKPEIITFAVRKTADQTVEGNRKLKNIDYDTKMKEKGAKKEDANRRSLRSRPKIDSEHEEVPSVRSIELEENNLAEKYEESLTNNKKDVKISAAKNKRRLPNKVADETEKKEKEISKSSNASEQILDSSKNTNSKTTLQKCEGNNVDVELKSKGKSRKKEKSPEPVGRMTRQRAFFEPVKVPVREPEEKDSENEQNKTTKTEEKIDFSSDDEQPLAKSIKLTKKKRGPLKKDKPIKEYNTDKILPSPTPYDETKRSVKTPLSNMSTQNKTVGRRSRNKGTEQQAESLSRKSDISSKTSEKKEPKRTAIKRNKTKNAGESDEEDSTGNIIPKRKSGKKMTETDHSQVSQTDFSENETKTGRPMRKTKEAATIYMELIGQKLNLDEFDEDDFSIDSFPELPNVKKAQQMENEVKQNAGNLKTKGKVNRRKQKFEIEEKKTIKEQRFESVGKLEKKGNENEKSGTDPQKLASAKVAERNSKEKLEKSFSDSDDEPLATKLVKPNDPVQKKAPKTQAKCKTNKDIVSQVALKSSIEEKPLLAATTSIAELVKPISEEKMSSFVPKRERSPNQIKQPNRIINTPASPQTTSPTFLHLERFPSPKVNPTFLTPKFDRTLERKIPVEPVALSPSATKTLAPASYCPKLDISNANSNSPNVSTSNSKKYEADNFLSANLMPSKEESGKIFGIASVSLAQSSGPDNTKCTLGKCGSIHRPVLGPVVPTEAYLGEQLSSKERRKAKVNMTHEQIQKWLIECASNPDEIQDDLDDCFEDPPKPTVFTSSPTPMRDERDSASTSTPSKTSKDLIKSESVWSSKGPSLKATPVVIKEDLKPPQMQNTDLKILEDEQKSITNKQKTVEKTIKIEKEINKTESTKTIASVSKLTREVVKSPKPSTSSTATSSPKHQKAHRNTTTVQKPVTPKGQKRQPVYSTKLSQTLKKKPQTSSFAAFSPENETSVYSFDKEDDVLPPVTKPFRRHSRRESNTEENSQSEKPIKSEKTPTKEPQTNSISVTLSPEENTKSIKVSLDGSEKFSGKRNSIEKQIANEQPATLCDSDSEGHTFYIPLQGATAGANISGKSSDLIQGVAVKLGREGPEGPNQKVVMHATLVTKAQMGANSTPMPDSMNVHEIVKNLLSSTNKESTSSSACGSKSVPIGTVQPRFKSNGDTQNPCGSGLQRVNSNSSLFSGSTKSRNAPPPSIQKKVKDDIPIKMVNNTAFPHRDDPTQMVEAPIFKPTEKEFQDPIEFIERITPIAARFGICKIIPPESFKPECRISDDMRFTAYNQYVHKMLHRWGPNARELSAIRKYLTTQNIAMTHPPWIGGMEVDLPRLYHTVQELGGLKEVIEKKKWARVAEEMCIPKLAQDRVTKLDDIYCKYLLPYDTLSPAERQKLFDDVEADWNKRETRAKKNADRCVNPESVSNEEEDVSTDDDEDSEDELDGVSMECIVKGRNMPLNAFYRIARNTMAMWFKNTEPTVNDVETEFWRHVSVRDNHVCVHSGSIDSSGWGYGFPMPGPKTKGQPCAKHPWNLKVLTNNTGSVLRSLGPVMGVTVATLHVGMLFSACCWYRDPHGLSWIEYLHTGASKVWYGIPDEQSATFRTTLTSLIPTHCQNKTIWLPCDTAMVPPHILTDRGVSLCRTVQNPGEFVVIFPRAYTSSVATGYVVSESVYFATSSWLDSAKDDFKDIHDSCEPAMFSLEQLLFAIASDQRVCIDILMQILPMITEVYDKEIAARQQLKAAGVTTTEKIPQSAAKSRQRLAATEENECDLCRANLYISMVKTEDGNIYCLQHALKNINSGNVQPKQCKLIFAYNIEDIENLLKKLNERLSQQNKKKSGSSGSGRKSQQKY